jgi:ankyrin repeat protein
LARKLNKVVALPSAFALLCILDASVFGKRHPVGKAFPDPHVAGLVRAALNNDGKEMDAQITQGASVNAVGKDGITPLFYVMAEKNLNAFTLLLEHGADPNYQLTDVPDKAFIGDSITSVSAGVSDAAYLKEALKHKGDPNLLHTREKTTPIFEAIFYGREENMKILLKAGANVNFPGRRGGITPPMWAVSGRRYDLVCILLPAGADYQIKNAGKRSLLDMINEDLANNRLDSSQKQWAQQALDYIKSQKRQS